MQDLIAISDGLVHREPRYRRYSRHRMWMPLLARLLGGASPWATAYWMQQSLPPGDELFGSDRLSADALGKRLVRIQRLLPKTSVLPPSTVQILLEDTERQVNVLRELTALCIVHRQRIDALNIRERELGMPLEQQRREVKAYARTLTQIFALQLALGIAREHSPFVANRGAPSRNDHQRAG